MNGPQASPGPARGSPATEAITITALAVKKARIDNQTAEAKAKVDLETLAGGCLALHLGIYVPEHNRENLDPFSIYVGRALEASERIR